MLRIFLNNAQQEKYAILNQVLNPIKGHELDNLPHRIKAINDELAICDIPLKINNNLTYTFTDERLNSVNKESYSLAENPNIEPLKSYYKKIILYSYKKYLLDQSNIFHLVKYLIINEASSVEDVVYDLNISTSYIYKLIGNFNKTSEELFGVTIEIDKKAVKFFGEANKIIALTFQFCKYFPSAHHITFDQFLNNVLEEHVIEYLRPYLMTICDKDESCTDKELIYELFDSTYNKKQSSEDLNRIAYSLIQQGGSLVEFCYNLIAYYHGKYNYVKIEQMSFFLIEMIRMITIIEVSPNNIIMTEADLKMLTRYSESAPEKYDEFLCHRNSTKDNQVKLKESTIKTLFFYITMTLEKSKPVEKIDVYIEFLDSIFITQLFIDSVEQVFNPEIVKITSDISEASVIITDNPDSINFRNEDTFIYLISDFITEFDNKQYLKFIMNILDVVTNSDEERILKNVKLLN